MKFLLTTLGVLGFAMYATPASADCTTRPDVWGGGYSTNCSDGSSSQTRPDVWGGGSTTTWNDGHTTRTRPDVWGGGYTTYGDHVDHPLPNYGTGTVDPFGYPR